MHSKHPLAADSGAADEMFSESDCSSVACALICGGPRANSAIPVLTPGGSSHARARRRPVFSDIKSQGRAPGGLPPLAPRTGTYARYAGMHRAMHTLQAKSRIKLASKIPGYSLDIKLLRKLDKLASWRPRG